MATRRSVAREPKTIALVDDLPGELEETLESLGDVRDEFNVKATSNESEVDPLLAEADLALIVDARLEEFDRSSLDIARDYSRVHPGCPVFLVSNFFHDDKADYEKMATMISPLTPLHKVNKRDIEPAEIKRWIAQELDDAARSMEGEVDSADRRAADYPPDVLEVLSITPQEWSMLDVDRQDERAELVYVFFVDVARNYLESSEATWIVFGGPKFDVLRWGGGVDSPPESLLDEIQAREGVVPFFFGDELEVDSIDAGGLRWPGTLKNRHYPGIRLRFDADLGVQHDFLFDTGADFNYLDRELANEEGLRLGRPRGSTLQGRPVTFRLATAAVTLLDGTSTAYGETTFRAVNRWFDTLGARKIQRGLVSTMILHDLRTAVRVCGKTRTLRIDEDIDDD